ncbi:MAG: membrane protein insertion efficiency factor YidD [Bacteroidetes bacterium]|nr:membrane protein insertion efficiency factor YidD [Bacteroidota bacterium]
MVLKKTVILMMILAAGGAFSVCSAQNRADSLFLATHITHAVKPRPLTEPFPRKGGPGAKLMYIPYWVYKQCISSQDGMSCSFTPSCANYAMQCIHQKGAVMGVLLGLDRMSRCHNMDWKHYLTEPGSLRWSDPMVPKRAKQ